MKLKSPLLIVSRDDPQLKALGRMPLPPLELIRASVSAASPDSRRLCRLWALHIAADAHPQVPPGELFSRAGNEEAARYDPAVPLFESSKSATGGATYLTRHGFNALLYGEREINLGLPPDPTKHLLTNDGRRGSGYRFIATGVEVLAKYAAIAEGFHDLALREYFLTLAQDALDGQCDRPLPDFHRLFARLTYGARQRRGGYLDISFNRINVLPRNENSRLPMCSRRPPASTARSGWLAVDRTRTRASNLTSANWSS